MTTDIAVIRGDRRLELLDRAGRARWDTGSSSELMWGTWGSTNGDSSPSLYSWPTWDPSGTRIACFRAGPEGAGPELVVQHADGVRSTVLVQFEDRIPIYAQWSPDGQSMAILSQADNRLCLSVVDGSGGPEKRIARGSPLFFTWADTQDVAAFVGGEPRARMTLIDASSGQMTVLPGQPGNFCAPIRVGGRTAYIARMEGRVSLWVADRSAAHEIERMDGLVAMLADPTGQRLAIATADDERSPYRDLCILTLDGPHTASLDPNGCTAFWWTPDGHGLVIARTDPRSGVVTWEHVEIRTGLSTHLCELRPTRDMRFYLRFFEQFAQSHPLVDPSGRFLLVAGELEHAGNQSGIWRLPLDGSKPERLGDGFLAVWGPATE